MCCHAFNEEFSLLTQELQPSGAHRVCADGAQGALVEH